MSARLRVALLAALAIAHGAPARPAAAPAAPVPAPAAPALPVQLGDFDSARGWTAQPADGVEMRLSDEPADRCACPAGALRVDFRFVKGGGYAVLRHPFD